jgi:hypothetical protein
MDPSGVSFVRRPDGGTKRNGIIALHGRPIKTHLRNGETEKRQDKSRPALFAVIDIADACKVHDDFLPLFGTVVSFPTTMRRQYRFHHP